jgi:hypothetical protein
MSCELAEQGPFVALLGVKDVNFTLQHRKGAVRLVFWRKAIGSTAQFNKLCYSDKPIRLVSLLIRSQKKGLYQLFCNRLLIKWLWLRLCHCCCRFYKLFTRLFCISNVLCLLSQVDLESLHRKLYMLTKTVLFFLPLLGLDPICLLRFLIS